MEQLISLKKREELLHKIQDLFGRIEGACASCYEEAIPDTEDMQGNDVYVSWGYTMIYIYKRTDGESELMATLEATVASVLDFADFILTKYNENMQ